MQYWRYEKDYGSGQESASSAPPEEMQTDEAQRAKALKEIEALMQVGARVLIESRERKYDNLFQRLHSYVMQYGGKIKAEISDEAEGGKIVAELPFWEFEDKECFTMLASMAYADYIAFGAVEGERGVQLVVRVSFFEYGMNKQEQDTLIEREIQKHARLLELIKKYENLVK